MPVRPARDRSHVNDLQQIKNVGPSIAADFRRIGIRTPSDLCQADPYELYERLCQVDGQRHDLARTTRVSHANRTNAAEPPNQRHDRLRTMTFSEMTFRSDNHRSNP